ncbi:MAG: LysR family transcriptional regulator [Myxococcales bacterium]|nr:LysR family transcriptional regulator [Myxococcales bacterium]
MPNNCLDLESIRCFLAAAHHGAFRPAAAAVHLSPPAFGDRIRRLEEDLGARLFERTTRKVRLTEAGRRFAEEAERLLEAEARCRARVLADGQEALPFELTVGTRFELGLSWLLPSLDTLSAAAPERTLHLSFGDTADLLRQLRRGEIDALVTSARLALTDLEYAPLFGETYTFVAARERARAHPLRRAADAARHTLVDADRDLPLFRYFLDAVPPEPAWRFARVERMGTIAAVRQRILHGHGVGVLPTYFIRDDLKARRLVRLFPKVTLMSDMFRLIWPAGHRRAPELRALAESLAKVPLR